VGVTCNLTDGTSPKKRGGSGSTAEAFSTKAMNMKKKKKLVWARKKGTLRKKGGSQEGVGTAQAEGSSEKECVGLQLRKSSRCNDIKKDS